VDRDCCPACNTDAFGVAALFATWPFSVRCPNCGALLRRRERRWLGVLCGSAAFALVVLSIIFANSGQVSPWTAALCIALGIFLLILPLILGVFEVIDGSSPAS